MSIPMTRHAEEIRVRLGLPNGVVRSRYTYKNLWWELNGVFFGYGDLDSADILCIKRNLRAYETFQGWNEHHMSRWQQTTVPMIRIKRDDIMMHADLVEEAGER
jgi:hypothetical protein